MKSSPWSGTAWCRAGASAAAVALLACLRLNAGLVARWDFDNGDVSNIVDTVAGVKGTPLGAVTAVDGVAGGKAIHFDGSSGRVVFPTQTGPVNLVGKDYTIAFWARSTGPGATRYQSLLSTDDSVDFTGGWKVFLDGGVVAASHNNGSAFADQNWYTGYLLATKWTHVAIVFNGVTRTLYVNGAALGSIATNGRLKADGDDKLHFGNLDAPSLGGEQAYYNGDLDDVQLYDEALAQDRILALASVPQVAGLAVANPGFESLRGTDPLFFDGGGRLLADHFTQFPVATPIAGSLVLADAVPGWSGGPVAGTIAYGTFPSGLPDGSNVAFVDGAGTLQQAVPATWQGNLKYRLTVDVAAVAGLPASRYAIGLFANGQPVAQDVNGTALPAAGFATVNLECTIPAASSWVGAPVEIRLSGLDAGTGRLLFDRVRLTAEVVQPAVGAVVNPDSLVALYRGDGNASDAVHGGSAAFARPDYVAGKSGKAFRLDGSNQVVVATAPALNAPAYTVEAWVNPGTPDGRVEVIAARESDADPGKVGFALAVRGPQGVSPGPIPLPGEIQPGNLCFRVAGLSASIPTDDQGWLDGLLAVPTNQWSHVVLSVAAGDVAVYVNGVLGRHLSGAIGTPEVVDAPVRIGSRADLAAAAHPLDAFNGAVDEFALYSRALGVTDVSLAFAAGAAGKYVGASPVFVTAPPQDQAVVAGNNVTFSVGASGSTPLSYQWKFNGADIPGATNSMLTLPGVRRSAAGRYSVVVCNAAGCAPEASGTLAVNPGPVLLQLVTSNTQSPAPLVVPVVAVCNGVENALSFSVHFDAARIPFRSVELGAGASGAQLLVNTSQVDKGSLGIALALPAGVALAEGTNVLVNLTFGTPLTATSFLTSLQWIDTPTVRQVADTKATPLSTSWISGASQVRAADFEGDASPLGAGDRQVTVTDWVQVGRYVAALDDLAPGLRFQQADCAPLATGGNGRLTLSDWVQAGRFAAGLDPLAAASGPTAPEPVGPGSRREVQLASDSPRVLAFAAAELVPGVTNVVPVTMTATGDENAVAFSVQFDPAVIRFVSATNGTATAKGTMNVNAKKAAQGQVGLALALGAGQKLAAGQSEVANLMFVVAPGGQGNAAAHFADTPVFREVASPQAEALPAVWSDTPLSVLPVVVKAVREESGPGANLNLSWASSLPGAVLEFSPDLEKPNWVPVPGAGYTQGDRKGLVIPLGAANGYYRLRVP